MTIKKALIFTWLIVLFSAVAALFWHVELIYSLPTPVPENYHPIQLGETLDLSGIDSAPNGQPILLHFYNPDCPCSRFNTPHFKALIEQYGTRIQFVIVPVGTNVSAAEIHRKLNLSIPVWSDPDLASQCGVYSTPQAVIIDARHQLYYRGNYNRSRYCTDKKTEYVRTALEALFMGDSTVRFDPIALKAYGCQLPLCTN
jgi:hypothetical protein